MAGATPIKVAFLGPKASYTHQATLNRFPPPKYDPSPEPTIAAVFLATQSNLCTYGVVPFENSSNGSVLFTLDLFADPQKLYPDIQVCGEIYLPVRHCLLGRRHRPHPNQQRQQDHPAPPHHAARRGPASSEDYSHIRTLYSHPQAWGQCKNFLSSASTHLQRAERHDVSSTSRAAELVAQDRSGTSAAIASKVAAEVNGLEVLAEGIEDVEGNCTRFFVLRRRRRRERKGEEMQEGKEAVEGGEEEGGEVGKEEGSGWKTLVSFTVEHGEPGALADCLAVFKRHQLNLTSINTRPSGETPWHYIFFVEFIGRKLRDGYGGAVNEALAELQHVAKSWRWLGSWPDELKASKV